MQTDQSSTPDNRDAEILAARNTLQLMLIEYGQIHIENLCQLLRLTRVAEEEYSRICVRRFCS